MLKEFRDFIARGNVSTSRSRSSSARRSARSSTSLVEGVLMPPLGMLLGNVDFSSLFIVLDHSKGDARLARGGEGGRHPGDRLRPLPQRRRQLPDRGLRRLHDREAGQPLQEGAAGQHQELPALPVVDSARGAALRGVLRGPLIAAPASATTLTCPTPATVVRRRALTVPLADRTARSCCAASGAG